MAKDATDAAKALAEEKGVDVDALEGSGEGGRVTKDDVEAATADENKFLVIANPNIPGHHSHRTAEGRDFFVYPDSHPEGPEGQLMSEAEFKAASVLSDPDGQPFLVKGVSDNG